MGCAGSGKVCKACVVSSEADSDKLCIGGEVLFLWSWRGQRESVVLRDVVLVSKRPSAGSVIELEIEELGKTVWVVVLVLYAGRSAAWYGLVDSASGSVGVTDCYVLVPKLEGLSSRGQGRRC